MRLHSMLFLFVVTFYSCEKEKTELAPDWTEYHASCDLGINHFILNEDTVEIQEILFYHQYYYHISVEFKDQISSFKLSFKDKPKSGIYKTVAHRITLREDLKECHGEFGGNHISSDNEVYVTNYGNGFMQITFCELANPSNKVKKISGNIMFRKL